MRCWAYVRERAAQLEIELPELPDAADPLEVRDAQAASGRWHKVPRHEVRVGDVVVMRLPGAPLHVGIVWPRRNMVAHLTDEGERMDRLRTVSALVLGIYRWQG